MRKNIWFVKSIHNLRWIFSHTLSKIWGYYQKISPLVRIRLYFEPHLWFNLIVVLIETCDHPDENAVMETSKPAWNWQRTWDWCEPGQNHRLKILPEQQTERCWSRFIIICDRGPALSRGVGLVTR